MPARVLDNPLVLPVLGLLLESPMHPYQVEVTLRDRSEAGQWPLNRGSLNNVVGALTTAGWIEEHERAQRDGRPARTVYALTDTGRAELVTRLDTKIRSAAREFSPFFAALSYLGALGREGAVDALTERAERLTARIESDQARLTRAHDEGVPRLFVVEADYALHAARSELAWIASTISDIHAGHLTWPAARTTAEQP
ncbi:MULTISPECIES: PadR family transcriptional regulator [unclassified Rhodococcus (in: high G+C Gram-positive bacteria)]|uniref:PadR family transcriptional regulator n=1 Tax=unclassified Rhodococcus (in: high G+C Gram-positive bacteria) TaxID=192944 RepID=UPI00163AD727|nr:MULTISPECIES: helix-turn-helix transcriptional regulator [unclassified Rhodococcus (in: high G+C Gram-positive bacteria)]MBC2642224.1 helix-turn-helix transcriptional regulator [Rhodococcus sp. 3A]MBC2893034.1 helix-turn-helix transcriptional regulator [Rhodococcus sp. 4CII]